MIKFINLLFLTALASPPPQRTSSIRLLQTDPPPPPAFEGVKTNDIITDSALCTQDCLAKNNIFCQTTLDKSAGNCCLPSNSTCFSVPNVCSNNFNFNAYKVFSCPFETTVCGSKNTFILTSDGFIASVQSTPSFKRNKACYYTL